MGTAAKHHVEIKRIGGQITSGPRGNYTRHSFAALKLSFNTEKTASLVPVPGGPLGRGGGIELIEFLIKMLRNRPGEGKVHDGECERVNNEIVGVQRETTTTGRWGKSCDEKTRKRAHR